VVINHSEAGVSFFRQGRAVIQRMNMALCCAVLALSMGLSGCAARNAYREGKMLIDSGKPLAGIQKLEEASQLDPSSAEYRAAYLRVRDSYSQRWVEQADQARQQSNYAEAERGYREALALQPRHEKVLNCWSKTSSATSFCKKLNNW
jgi:tetratricopeptide (TPR) repeat protein